MRQSGLGTGGDPNAAALTNAPKQSPHRNIIVSEPDVQSISGNVGVTLRRTASEPTLDQALWVAIRNRTQAISFDRYRDFLNRVLRWQEMIASDQIERRLRDLGTNLHGIGAYRSSRLQLKCFCCSSAACESRTGIAPRPEFDLLEEQSRLGEPVSAGEIADRLRGISRPSAAAPLHYTCG